MVISGGPSWWVLLVTQSLDGAITVVTKSSRAPVLLSLAVWKSLNKGEVVGVVFSSDND